MERGVLSFVDCGLVIFFISWDFDLILMIILVTNQRRFPIIIC